MPAGVQREMVAEIGAGLGEELVEDPAHGEDGGAGVDRGRADRAAHLAAGRRGRSSTMTSRPAGERRAATSPPMPAPMTTTLLRPRPIILPAPRFEAHFPGPIYTGLPRKCQAGATLRQRGHAVTLSSFRSFLSRSVGYSGAAKQSTELRAADGANASRTSVPGFRARLRRPGPTSVGWHIDAPRRHCDGLPDGSLRGSKGNAVRASARCRGCPRNCKRRALHQHVTGRLAWEDDERAVTREPGDLPSVVVTRETRRAGCPDGCRGGCVRAPGEASFAVTCHCRRPRSRP